VKNLAYVFSYIRTLVNDKNLVVMTLIGLGKHYSQFKTYFVDFKNG
jgi:hypothetical protein